MNKILHAILVTLLTTSLALAQPAGNTQAGYATSAQQSTLNNYVSNCTGSYSVLSTAAVVAASLKSSTGVICDIHCFNKGASTVFMRIYSQSGTPASGDTANIVWRGMVPTSTGAGGYSVLFQNGRSISSGIGIRITANEADNDNTAITANNVMCNVGYK